MKMEVSVKCNDIHKLSVKWKRKCLSSAIAAKKCLSNAMLNNMRLSNAVWLKNLLSVKINASYLLSVKINDVYLLSVKINDIYLWIFFQLCVCQMKWLPYFVCQNHTPIFCSVCQNQYRQKCVCQLKLSQNSVKWNGLCLSKSCYPKLFLFNGRAETKDIGTIN